MKGLLFLPPLTLLLSSFTKALPTNTSPNTPYNPLLPRFDANACCGCVTALIDTNFHHDNRPCDIECTCWYCGNTNTLVTPTYGTPCAGANATSGNWQFCYDNCFPSLTNSSSSSSSAPSSTSSTTSTSTSIPVKLPTSPSTTRSTTYTSDSSTRPFITPTPPTPPTPSRTTRWGTGSGWPRSTKGVGVGEKREAQVWTTGSVLPVETETVTSETDSWGWPGTVSTGTGSEGGSLTVSF